MTPTRPTRTPTPRARKPKTAKTLPPPTPSEAAFERLLARFEAGEEDVPEIAAPVAAAPPVASGEPELGIDAFVEQLFAQRERYLARDRFASIGDAGEFFTKVVGVTFEGRQDVVAGLVEGATLAFERQPDNPHDPNAIAVRYGALQLGYLKREIAKHLAPKFDDGVRYRASVASITGGGTRSVGVNIRVVRERDVLAAPAGAASSAAGRDDVRRALIGERDLREPQRAVLQRLEAGHATLAVFGTGRGKSLCFQYPAAVGALERGARTLVMYPLRALANDQYEALRRRLGPLGLRIYRANGAIDEAERADLDAALADGSWDIVCSTPEFVQYHRERFGAPHNRASLVVIDEAHHLFESRHRPAYAHLGATLDALGRPQVLALTATANRDTFAHLRETLRLAAWVIDPTVRENLHLVDARGTRDKAAYLLEALEAGGKAIVYCNSRSEAMKVAERLRARFGNEVAFYHAGVPSAERSAVENYFRAGELRVVVATSAFGEGIDLPDVRNVFLYHLNFDFTEFNQQAGRAGRDGADAHIHLLFGEGDRRINDFIIAKQAPSLHVLRELYRVIRGTARDAVVRLDNAELARIADMDMVAPETIGTALRIFDDAGLVETGIDDDGRYVRFLPAAQKIDMTKNARFAEGEAERESFQGFCELALGAKVDLLQSVIDRPIYPDGVALHAPA